MMASQAGVWTTLLVGPWYPSENSIQAADAILRRRRKLAADYENHGNELFQARTGPLAEQEGATADATRAKFEQGEHLAASISTKNAVKSESFRSAGEAISGLTSALNGISARGNEEIDRIQRDPSRVDKVGAISGVVIRSNTEAIQRNVEFSTSIKNAIARVLAADGDIRTPEEFLAAHGLGRGLEGSPPDEASVRDQVTKMLDNQSQTAQDASGNPAASNFRKVEGASLDLDPNPDEAYPNYAGNTLSGGVGQMHTALQNRPAPGASGNLKPAGIGGVVHGGLDTPSAAGPNLSPDVSGLPAANAAVVASPGNHFGTGGVGDSGAQGVSPTTSGLSPSTPSAPLSPESLAESFNSGMQSGAPMSAGAEALSQGISETAQQAPQNPAPPAPVAPTVPSGGFAYEAPQHFSEPAAPAPAPTETTQQPMYAAPVAAAPAAPVAPMAPPPAATAGPLPAYGSDLRPTAAAAAPPPAAAPAPLSAPTSAASGTAASNQPAVVRQAPTAAAQTGVTPAGIAETAMGSAATGAIAGAAAQQSIEQARLDRLLEAVARQEPKLKWAIGDREDGTTVLVTDLASGWIPPHIEIPKGVELLQPQKRRGGLEHLLGETVNHSIWTPGHYLPNAKDVEPVEMTFRARQVPDIDELNWELTQATNWRDGLPRLAHTLTKAGIAGTGVLESEADLLYEHLTAARDKVVRAYPGSVDPTDVGNWQLLAAISGLIAKDKTTLKYHFAWFQALSMATQGGSR